jgi:sarcosine oxidase/L-pipecolate oxidase
MQPNEKRIVKMAMHLAGYTHTRPEIAEGKFSTPRTVLSDPDTGLLIPKANLQQLRENLRHIYPTLAEKPFTATRVCWYLN